MSASRATLRPGTPSTSRSVAGEPRSTSAPETVVRADRALSHVIETVTADATAGDERTVLVVSHGGFITTLLRQLMLNLFGNALKFRREDVPPVVRATAERVAATCLRHPLVASVDVTVHKPDARLPVSLTDVSVTLTRSRP